MRTLPINELIQLKITRQLYQHASAAIFATMLNSVIVAIVFRNIVDARINIGWAAACVFFLALRFFFTRSVLKKKMTLADYRRRLWQFGITVCVSGILFGSAGVIFLSPDRPAYNAFIFFLMGGMFAGSVGAFAIKRRVFAAFAAPIILPVTAHSFILGGEINTAMALMGIIFIAMMLLVVVRMNTTMVAAFRLGILNTQLARNKHRLNRRLLAANKRFRQLSFYDSLTNVKNRRFIFDILQCEVDRFTHTRHKLLTTGIVEHDPSETVYGIYIIDIDHFKQVNDTWGHKCGDRVLIQFVEVLKTLIRKDDILSRWGGEEFVIVLKRTVPEYLPIFAEKTIRAIAAAQFMISETQSIGKTCSLGYAEFPFFRNAPLSLSLEQTIEIADRALYRAKAKGRNQAVRAAYDAASAGEMTADKAALLGPNLSEAIEKGHIRFI
jgi:diguanylate cyclase (GGDEF)-like protein